MTVETVEIEALPLTAEAFAPFGDVIEARGDPDVIINRGRCGRFHDRALLSTDSDGRIGVSVFASKPVRFPVTIDLFERHPLGSQAFLPMSGKPFLVVVASDTDGRPGAPRAFVTAPGQGVNYHRNIWHAVLMPLDVDAVFAVVDRIGPGKNLEEHELDMPVVVSGPALRDVRVGD